MSNLTQHPHDDDLVAYLLDDLGGARLEYLEAHLRHCPECRVQLDELGEMLQILREFPDESPYPDDRATIKARLVLEEREMRSRRTPTLLAAAASLLLVLAIAVFAWQPFAQAANNGISEFVRLIERESANRPNLPDTSDPPGVAREPRGTPVDEFSALAFVPVVVEQLPADLTLVGTTSDGPERLTLEYRNETLRVLVVQSPGVSGAPEFGPDARSMQVDDVEVIYATNRATLGIVRLYWVHGGVGFSLSVIRSQGFELARDQAVAIVEQFVATSGER